MRRAGLCLGLIALLGGCEAAMPGYEPPSAKLQKIKAMAPKGGGFAEDGSYFLTEQEKGLDCKNLAGSMKIKILQMRAADGRVKPTATASQMQQLSQTFEKGSSYGHNLDADLARDRRRLDALNARMAEKGCKTFDLEAELKPGNAASPVPTGAAKPATATDKPAKPGKPGKPAKAETQAKNS